MTKPADVCIVFARPCAAFSIHDHLTIQRFEDGEEHFGGIVIPDTAREKPQQGQVIALTTDRVGPAGHD